MRTHRGICHVCGAPGADEVDHVLALALGGDDDPANRRPIHSRPCHVAKTAADRAEVARRRAAGLDPREPPPQGWGTP